MGEKAMSNVAHDCESDGSTELLFAPQREPPMPTCKSRRPWFMATIFLVGLMVLLLGTVMKKPFLQMLRIQPMKESESLNANVIVKEEEIAPHFMQISFGTCEDVHMEPILDDATCEAAARYLKLGNDLDGTNKDLGRPEGCYWFNGEKLIMGKNPKNKGKGADMSDPPNTREPLCRRPPAVGKCSHEGENCLLTQCCMHPFKHCYQKNTHWATCKVNCTKGIFNGDPEGYRTKWSCQRLGSAPLKEDKHSLPSLHCFALIQDQGYEVDLTRDLFNHGLGIFKCDSWTMYSGSEVSLGSIGGVQIKAKAIDGGIKAQVGGIYMTLLNTEVFIKVWKAVFADSKIWNTDWTIKTDADCVFIPSRVRARLAQHNPMNAMYLNNCKYGMHGPMEVISKAGMAGFSAGIDICIMRFKAEFPLYGEDVFVRHCLRSLAVHQYDDFQLLSEDHCDENPSPCVSGKAAFHPFKNTTSYLQCLEQATGKKVLNNPQTTI